MNDNNKSLAILPLSEMALIDDKVPADFYKNSAIYESKLDAVLAIAKTLVHEISPDGRKAAQKDVALMRKFAKQNKANSVSVFKSLTEKIGTWKALIYSKAVALETEADNIMIRFDEMEKAQLDEIRAKLDMCLKQFWDAGVELEFRSGSVDKMVIATAVTPMGNLTKKAIEFCKNISDSNFARQTKIKNRHLIIENKCLKADINPPLTKKHFGDVFYAEDEIFDAKVDDLIESELARMAELKARIEKQLEVDNEKKIADALKAQQAEANRMAVENAKKVEPEPALIEKPVITPESLRAQAKNITECAERASTNSERNNELAKASALKSQAAKIEQESVPLPATRTVVLTLTIEWQGVGEKTSNTGLESFLKRKLPDEISSRITRITSETKNG